MPKSKANKLYYIVVLGLVTGALDGIAALILSYPVGFSRIFRYIASGYFGPGAFTEDNMVLWGLLFHFFIATTFSLMLLELQPKFKMLTKNNYLLAILYGVLIWLVMKFAVLPLTNIPKPPESAHFNVISELKEIIALVICLGLPITFVADKYYMKKAKRSANRKVRTLG